MSSRNLLVVGQLSAGRREPALDEMGITSCPVKLFYSLLGGLAFSLILKTL